MSPPIDIDGSEIQEATIDGQDVSEITIDGQQAADFIDIPDSGMFQSPIYQWASSAINASDGASPVDWPESLAALGDASAVGTPTYRSDEAGFEAVEYEASNDEGHNWNSDSQLPTGTGPLSIAATIYVKSISGLHTIISWGESALDQDPDGTLRIALLAQDSDGVRLNASGNDVDAFGGSISTGQWITVGGSLDESSGEVYLNGSNVGSDSSPDFTRSITDGSESLGYVADRDDFYLDAYVYDIVVSDVKESDQAFSDYHNDRLG